MINVQAYDISNHFKCRLNQANSVPKGVQSGGRGQRSAPKPTCIREFFRNPFNTQREGANYGDRAKWCHSFQRSLGSVRRPWFDGASRVVTSDDKITCNIEDTPFKKLSLSLSWNQVLWQVREFWLKVAFIDKIQISTTLVALCLSQEQLCSPSRRSRQNLPQSERCSKFDLWNSRWRKQKKVWCKWDRGVFHQNCGEQNQADSSPN